MNNLMNTLPTDLVNIINTYKLQLEHLEKFNHCIKQINNIEYEIEKGCYTNSSRIKSNGEEVKYLLELLAEGREIVEGFTQFQPHEQTEKMFDEATKWLKKVK